MQTKIITILSILFFSLASYGSEGGHDHGHDGHKDHDHSAQKATLKKVGSDKLVIKVKGMVCAFCAQGIEKNFNKQKQVKTTKVNLETMEVTINLKKGASLPEPTIKKLVIDAGFAYAGLKK